MGEPTIATRLIAPLLETYAKSQGELAAHELRAQFGLDEDQLVAPEARYPLARFYDLLEHAAEASADPLLGAHYSQQLDPASFDVLGFLSVSSPTLGVAFERMFRYQALLYEGEVGVIERRAGLVTLTMQCWGPPRRAHQLWMEAAAVDIVVNGRELAGHEFEVREIRLRHAAPSPAHARQLAETLAAPLRFEAEDYAIVIPESVLELPLPSANEALFAYFDREAARRSAALEPVSVSVFEDLHRMIRASLPEGVPELPELAARLGLSARTLQRRLAEHGTTLRKETDAARHELALVHLAAELSIAEVSYLLGFSEPSAFHRAFKRWTGRTPTKWRAERRAPAS